MPTYDEVIVTTLFFSLLAVEYATGVYHSIKRPAGDWLVDGISFIQLGLIKPSVMLLAFSLGALLLPDAKNLLQDTPFWVGFLIVFLPDDFLHYWMHRLAHDRPILWGFHRTHHTANVYNTAIAFRENWLWYWIMPGFWWSGLMVYLGLIEAVILSTAVIGVHNLWLHNGYHFDQVFYKKPGLKTLTKYLEFIINTPGLHRGHHGLGKDSVPDGNYAQTLFIWDVIFGTATFNQGVAPEYYGTKSPESMKQPWYYHLWWPIFRRQVKEETGE